MSDPPRLIETASTEAELLEAWSSMRAPDHARAKALALAGLGAGAAAVGASMAAKSGATAAGAAAGTGSAVATTGAGVVAAKWVAAIGIVAAIGGGSVVASRKTSAPTAPAVAATTTAIRSPERQAHEAHRDEELRGAPSAEPAAPVVAAADLPNAEPQRVHSTPEPARVVKPAPSATTAATVESAPEPAPVASTLGAEVSALDSARNAIRTGEPARALRELDAFDAQHPSSALAEDAALLRFDAYVALGDRAGADKAARTFLARYPSSPRGTKVRRYLDGTN